MNFSGYQRWGSKRRYPIKFSESPTQKNKNKWDKIIDTFMEGSIDELKQIYRNGTRGRIFEILQAISKKTRHNTLNMQYNQDGTNK